jgi:flavin-dependent dehydrogenase
MCLEIYLGLAPSIGNASNRLIGLETGVGDSMEPRDYIAIAGIAISIISAIIAGVAIYKTGLHAERQRALQERLNKDQRDLQERLSTNRWSF